MDFIMQAESLSPHTKTGLGMGEAGGREQDGPCTGSELAWWALFGGRETTDAWAVVASLLVMVVKVASSGLTCGGLGCEGSRM